MVDKNSFTIICDNCGRKITAVSVDDIPDTSEEIELWLASGAHMTITCKNEDCKNEVSHY
ncbi:hypothetical protein SAMN05421839_10617 [Halolactibacillus halophilus]|uniref:Uncharacterized protein n=1 Tax=Halolactibacillus halophilus TaxID=306540 RepID=A0A1I5MM27_9BACI|nr:hypothetical protein [Halolactibacillus halophilus]GEM02509.1 hypothetical protein HHA03_20410 [Halolactibacillus halophilus]SFP10655.1 hypothetical protein SAMN05421839_10617 [Halolactibacillus halophilus]